VKLLSATIFDLVLYFMTGLSRTRISISDLSNISRSILHLLFVYVCGSVEYACNFQNNCCTDKNCRTSSCNSRSHGPCNCKLRWLFHPTIFHETMVQMDILHQSCISISTRISHNRSHTLLNLSW